MAALSPAVPLAALDEQTYRRRVRAWTLYDWANSAFATTILAAILPVYYSTVAGSTLPSEATATAYWTLGLSISLLISAILSPILGTISDITRGKKRFLAVFTAVGILGTGLLVLVDTGDWLLASAFFIFARIGFVAAYTFYDSLLPHIARPQDQDAVSARGYALGYLGGGLLLAINVGMIFAFPGSTWGARLSFLSVAVWWAVFSIPLFLRVPEPNTATESLQPGQTVVGVAFRRIVDTLRDIRRYRELFKYLIAYLIYNDAIGTIVGVAAIYGAELGFGSTELILALLLVQFVAMPFALIFGRLPNPAETRRAFYLAFIVFNLVALPVVGLIGRTLLPETVSGTPRTPYPAVGDAVGEGTYAPDQPTIRLGGNWTAAAIPAAQSGLESDSTYYTADAPGATLTLPYNGQRVTLTYSTGPDRGIFEVLLNGETLLEDGEPVRIDGYHADTERYRVRRTFAAETEGVQTLELRNTGERNPASNGTRVVVESVEVLPPARTSSLPLIIGAILLTQAVGALFAFTIGRTLFAPLAARLSTRSSILLSLVVYSVIAAWGYFLDSTVEFWFLAWMVAVVQGGSQALSRSLFASMSPASKSGEFFGLYGIMEKFSSILGPLLFAIAAATLGSSRPAILTLIAFFIIGGFLLTRVNIAEGQRIAREEDAAAAPATS